MQICVSRKVIYKKYGDVYKIQYVNGECLKVGNSIVEHFVPVSAHYVSD